MGCLWAVGTGTVPSLGTLGCAEPGVIPSSFPRPVFLFTGGPLSSTTFFLSAAHVGRQHGEHFRVEIFEGCNFTGQCLEFREDCPFLPSRGWAQNCVNAIKVYGDGA